MEGIACQASTKWLLAAKGTRGQISRDDAQKTLCDISRWEQMHMVRAGIFWFSATWDRSSKRRM